jgi:predicted deacylase
MTGADYFSPTYTAAAERFRYQCRGAGAVMEHHVHPRARGPGDEQLAVDVARFGSPNSDAVLIVISGVHGIEGFAGAACQLAFVSSEAQSLEDPPGAIVFVHALNPWGFAHWRRVNEDNVDLNRNFVDHARPHPGNRLYAELHPVLLPPEWSASDRAATERRLNDIVRSAGVRAVQTAITSGQYSHPDGLFYGGRAPAWSNRIWRELIQRHTANAERVAVVDIHTGLGPHADAELILRARRDTRSLHRARAWFGPRVTTSEDGTSSSTEIDGNTPRAVEDAVPGAEITAVTLELGTLSSREVLDALRSDHWIARGPVARMTDELRAESRRQMVAAFCPEGRRWRDAAIQRGTEVLQAAWLGVFGCKDRSPPDTTG